MNKRTALISALSLNLFFVLVQAIVIVYGLYIGEDIRGIASENILQSTFRFQSLTMFLVNTLIAYFFLRIEFWCFKRFSYSRKKLLFSLFLLFFSITILSPALSQLLGFLFRGELAAYRYSVAHFVKDLTFFISTILISTLIYLTIKNQEKLRDNKNLAIENFKNRYNALKNQTDPHFLFNSFNSLNGLIGYDDELAQEYVMQLASVFRYTMQEHSVVSLSDELEFTNSYIYLMKIRYGEALLVEIDIPDRYSDFKILPVSIQTLVENAIKHNIVTLQKPLSLKIKLTQEETIAVENSYQPRDVVSGDSGVGLSNLNERYWLMYKENINVYMDNEIFRVELPLMKNRVEIL